MIKKLLFISIVLILILGCSGIGRPDCSDLWKSQDHIMFSIENTSESYSYGKPIPLKATFTNKGTDIAYLELDEVTPGGSVRDWPPGVDLCLKNPAGEVLTTSNLAPLLTKGRFWSGRFLESSDESAGKGERYCCRQKGDCVSVPAGATVERTIPIDKLLMGCRSVGQPLPAGGYLAQLRLGHLYSNEIEIWIVPNIRITAEPGGTGEQ